MCSCCWMVKRSAKGTEGSETGLGVAGAYSKTLRCRKAVGATTVGGARAEAQVVAAVAANLVSQQEAVTAGTYVGIVGDGCGRTKGGASARSVLEEASVAAGGLTEAEAPRSDPSGWVSRGVSIASSSQKGWRAAPRMVQ